MATVHRKMRHILGISLLEVISTVNKMKEISKTIEDKTYTARVPLVEP